MNSLCKIGSPFLVILFSKQTTQTILSRYTKITDSPLVLFLALFISNTKTLHARKGDLKSRSASVWEPLAYFLPSSCHLLVTLSQMQPAISEPISSHITAPSLPPSSAISACCTCILPVFLVPINQMNQLLWAMAKTEDYRNLLN